MNLKLEALIAKLELLPHPEGGWYKESYRSSEFISKEGLPERFSSARNYATGIYFLLAGKNFSAFHRIKSDEIWHFYAGCTLNVYVINLDGSLDIIKVGSDLDKGEVFQAVVKAGFWFASRCAEEDNYSLVGCTVSPGFDFADFEMAKREELIQQYQEHQEIIRELTRI